MYYCYLLTSPLTLGSTLTSGENKLTVDANVIGLPCSVNINLQDNKYTKAKINHVYDSVKEWSNEIGKSIELTKWIASGIEICCVDKYLRNIISDNKEKLDLNGLLLVACYKGSDDMIRYLLDMGADIESKSRIGSTPILFLAERDNIEMVKYLLSLGADPTVKNSENENIYSYAGDKTKEFINKLFKDCLSRAMASDSVEIKEV